MSQVSTLTPFTLARSLYRHKGKAALFFVLAMGATVAALLVIPPKYESEAKLFVRLGRESIALDPTATTGQTVSVNESRDVEINSIIEVLRSRSIAEKVVEKLTPERILGKQAGEGDSQAPASGLLAALPTASGSDVPQVSLQEKAVDAVAKSLDAYAPKQTTVISVRCETGSPELAQATVQAALDVYFQEHARVHRTAGSYEFFVEQEALLHERLDRAAEKLRDAKNEIGLASIDGRRATLQSLLGSIESRIAMTESELAAANAKAERLDESMSLLPQRLTTQETTGFPNVAADNMRQQLYQLEILERELRAKYTDEHPRVIATRQQLAEARKILEQQIPERSQATVGVNTTRQQLELQLLTEKAAAGSLLALADSLRSQRELVVDELKSLNHHEVRIGELEREVQLLESSYRGYADKLEQARIDDALEQGRISNVNVVQKASYESRPVKPQKLMILVLGLAVAVAGAAAIAFVADYLDPSLRTSDDVERRLDLPVLLSIPRVSGRGVLLN